VEGQRGVQNEDMRGDGMQRKWSKAGESIIGQLLA